MNRPADLIVKILFTSATHETSENTTQDSPETINQTEQKS
jgi:hypothetical protein